MPRKINYGVDYYDDYDAFEEFKYDDYEYNYDSGNEIAGELPQTNITQESDRLGVWRCPICTFDNGESLSACDICGVLRNPLVKSSGKGDLEVGGMCKDSGASVMAESLFASLLHQTCEMAVEFQRPTDLFFREDCHNFHKFGNIQGHFHDFLKAFSSQNHYKNNIVPFKFDIPSPDDLVSNGMRSSKVGFKGISLNVAEKNSGVPQESSAQKSRSGMAGAQGSSSISGAQGSSSTSALVSKSKHDDIKGSSPKASGDKPQNVSGSMSNFSLSVKSGPPNSISGEKAYSCSHFKPEKWMLADLAENQLGQLNLAIVGHVDSGKSTLSGRLLHLLGQISQKVMHKYEREAKLQGKGSFAYAWALDQSSEERERGITMTVAVAYFDSKKYHVVLLDSPGHKDFVPNMISGATQADAAILVIDASIGSFEVGMDSMGGQTKEHAQLVRSFGADQIIVAVNKMDAVEYAKERFDLIKKQLGSFLHSCGFKDSSMSWVPLSAMGNQNLVAAPDDARLSSWFHGNCLLDAIDSLHPPSRDYAKPVLMPICDVVRTQSQGQVSACGKLDAGAMRSGTKVLVMPYGDVATVRSLEQNSLPCTIARAGDNVIVGLHGIDANRVMPGGVLCHHDFPVAVANHLELKILILDIATPILIGSQLEFHIHHAKAAASVVRILSVVDPKTGKITKKAPRCLTAKQSAIIEVVLNESVCVEEYSSCRALGRVYLRASGRTVALGIVTRVVRKPE